MNGQQINNLLLTEQTLRQKWTAVIFIHFQGNNGHSEQAFILLSLPNFKVCDFQDICSYLKLYKTIT